MQELHNITSLLRNGGHGAIIVFHSIILQRRRHGNTTAREVGVVVERFHHFLAGGFVHVSSQKGKHVIVSFMACANHDRQIRWKGTIVGRSSLFIILIGGWKLIVGFGGAFKHFSFLIGSIHHHAFLGHGGHFFLGVCHTGQFTPTNKFQRVTGGADFAVHLESTTQSTVIEGSKETKMPPRIRRGCQHTFGHEGYRERNRSRGNGSAGCHQHMAIVL
mmetsp:Transcript_18708/g.38698  ORF Transcript_18708/g.38698 Transcript_18708/m.38698 type:complete len:218 (-) Transcript_18708:62-715(-)